MAKITRLTLDQTGGGLERRRLHLRDFSEASDLPLETLGQDLRTARMRKGDDLAGIAAVLKIRKDQLQGLEESNFDLLPGRAYTIGFVRAYAQYLGMDPDESVERLKAEIAGRNEVKEPIVTPAPRESRLPPGGVVLAFFLVISLIYAGYYVVVSLEHMRSPPVTPVPARLSQMTAPASSAPMAQDIAGVPHSARFSGRTGHSAGKNL